MQLGSVRDGPAYLGALFLVRDSQLYVRRRRVSYDGYNTPTPKFARKRLFSLFLFPAVQQAVSLFDLNELCHFRDYRIYWGMVLLFCASELSYSCAQCQHRNCKNIRSFIPCQEADQRTTFNVERNLNMRTLQ